MTLGKWFQDTPISPISPDKMFSNIAMYGAKNDSLNGCKRYMLEKNNEIHTHKVMTEIQKLEFTMYTLQFTENIRFLHIPKVERGLFVHLYMLCWVSSTSIHQNQWGMKIKI